MTACWVHGCTTPATRTVQIQAPGWRVPESRRVCIAHAESITQEPPMSKTLTQAERVLEDVKNHPWTTVGDIVRRTRDAKAAARLVQAVQAGTLVRIGEKRSYRYAVPGTPIPGLAEVAPVEESPDFGIADPPGATERRPTLAERLARAVGVDLTGGDAAIVEAVERIAAERDELAEKLEGWTDVLERTREQRDAFEALANRAAAAGEGLGGAVLRIAEALGCELSPTDQHPVADLALDAAKLLRSERDRLSASIELLAAAAPPFFAQFQDPAHVLVWPVRDAAGCQTGRWECNGPQTGKLGGDAETGWTAEQVLESVAQNIRAEVPYTYKGVRHDTQALVTLRNALHAALDLTGVCSDEEVIEAARDAVLCPAQLAEMLDLYGVPAEVGDGVLDRAGRAFARQAWREPGAPAVLATANASLREVGDSGAGERAHAIVLVEPTGTRLLFDVTHHDAKHLARVLFEDVTVALLAPSPSKPTPVAPEFPTAPTPDDDQDMPF